MKSDYRTWMATSEDAFVRERLRNGVIRNVFAMNDRDETLVLRHDDRLKATFDGGRVHVGMAPYFPAQFNLRWTGTPARTMVDIANELIAAHPDYTENGDHAIVFVYERLGLGVSGDPLASLLEQPQTWFEYWLNGLWREYYVPLGTLYDASSVGAITRYGSPERTPNIVFQPLDAASPEQLIQAAQALGYLLLHEGVGIRAPGKPFIFHTCGSEHLIPATQYGEMPGGVELLALDRWNGESTDFSERDLVRMPDTP